MNTTKPILAVIFFSLAFVAEAAEKPIAPEAIKIAPIFGPHMVLQREMPIPIDVDEEVVPPAESNARPVRLERFSN